MKKTDILIKREEDPILEIDWHLSPEGIISNTLFRNIWHIEILQRNMADLMRIVDPTRMNNNILDYKAKRDNVELPIQTRIYFNNQMKRIYDSAYSLLSNMSNDDEIFYQLNKEDIKEILIAKKIEYGIDTFKQILKTQK